MSVPAIPVTEVLASPPGSVAGCVEVCARVTVSATIPPPAATHVGTTATDTVPVIAINAATVADIIALETVHVTITPAALVATLIAMESAFATAALAIIVRVATHAKVIATEPVLATVHPAVTTVEVTVMAAAPATLTAAVYCAETYVMEAVTATATIYLTLVADSILDTLNPAAGNARGNAITKPVVTNASLVAVEAADAFTPVQALKVDRAAMNTLHSTQPTAVLVALDAAMEAVPAMPPEVIILPARQHIPTLIH